MVRGPGLSTGKCGRSCALSVTNLTQAVGHVDDGVLNVTSDILGVYAARERIMIVKATSLFIASSMKM